MFHCVHGRWIARLAFAAFIDSNDSELNLWLLHQPNHFVLQGLVAGGRVEGVDGGPVGAGLLLLDDVVGDGGSAVRGGGRPADVGGGFVVVGDFGSSRLAGLI